MPLLARNIATPLWIDVGRGAVRRLPDMLTEHRISARGDVAVVVGPGQGDRITEELSSGLESADFHRVAGGTVEVAESLSDELGRGDYDAVVAAGGGRTIDTAKYAATRAGLPLVSVATSLAHDGLASPVSVLEHGTQRGSYGIHIPIAVVVDLDLVHRAPARQTRCGVGDALSNLNAIADWRLAHEARGEPIDGLAVALARTGAEALLHHPGAVTDDDFLTVLAESLILGGLAMAVNGSSRPCSGGCHEISHAIDRWFGGMAPHGEQVGVGALFCTYLRGDDALLRDLSGCLARHGLPRLPEEIGLTNADFAEVVRRAPATRPDRYTALEHGDLSDEDLVHVIKAYGDAIGH